jgi:GTP-binding protein EngB required for normal cell division
VFGSARPEAKSGAQLNEAQRRRVRTTLARVDELLEQVQRSLAASPEGGAPFSREIADSTPLQSKVIADFTARARALMLEALQRLGVDLPAREVSALWAARVALRSAQVAASELDPRDLRGYGTLGDEAARELSGTIGPLLGLLEQMESFLAQGAGAALEARLRRLEGVTDELHLLTETARIVQAHGLVEFRAALDALIARAEANDLEIAVFGRVNAGKSSLLNCVLGESVLPVGATPVTSIPVRIVHGQRSEGRVWFADAIPQIFALGRLAEFVSESQNPANARHVTRLELRLTSPLLARGVSFVDSPGYGALASANQETALAYLPRCDAGILAIDAASVPTADDAMVVERLLRSGARVSVVLTKADALADTDALNALIHTRRLLASTTGTEVPVDLLSVKGRAVEYCRHWQQSVLSAMIDEGRALRRRSMRRKAAALAEDVATALERRLSGRSANADPGRWAQAESALEDAARQLEEARAAHTPLLPDPAKQGQEILGEAAYNASVILQRDPVLPNDLTPVIVAATRGRERAAANAAARELGRLRAVLANALAQAAASSGRPDADHEELARPAEMPLADAAAFVRPLLVTRKPSATGLRWLLEAVLRRRMRRAGVGGQSAAALAHFERQLQEWRTAQLELLRRDFSASTDRLRALHRRDTNAAPEGTRAALLEDLARLQELLGEPAVSRAPAS